ncbi:MAG: transposase [Candidatus Nealsonbacteria bacterium]|nr:transposase [Candidatus Nealsonbacteria bacterium]
MPVKRPPLINGEIYHIVIRAIEGMKLFRNEKDYYRMIHSLFVFNNNNAAISTYRRQGNEIPNRARSVLALFTKRKLLVEVLAFCLMSNHIHLLVRQVSDGGISKLMRKIGAGYGGYYNKKYQRKGRLFDGRYRAIHIENDNQLKIVFVYIHTNPVAILIPNWKEGGIIGKELNKVIEFIENYRWSSYPDCLGKKNFPSLTSREFLINEMDGIKEAQRFINDWLQAKRELRETSVFKEISLE